MGDGESTPGGDALPADRRRLGELLVEAGVLTQIELTQVLGLMQSRERLGAAVLRLGLATDVEIADAVAAQLGVPRVDLDSVGIDPAAAALLPARIAAQHDVVPLMLEGGVLLIATADPTDVVAMDDVRIAAGVRSVQPVVATPKQLEAARRTAYRGDAGPSAEPQTEPATPARRSPERPAPAVADQPVVRLVDELLTESVRARASDIHLESTADGLRVRIRVDGLLRELGTVQRNLAGQALSRLKIMARLDIAERRLPQDGRATVEVDGQAIDLRVSTMPTMHGETIVLRVLPQGGDRVAIDELGLDERTRGRFLDALGRPQGLVLVTGPTGSGKTTTLYSGLAAVSDPTRNVLTLEDPVEVQLPGVNQTQIEPKIGLTFARGLRHVLRQDPDVVLVGEIRDQETAQLAVEASFTGHLVLATLHTNDAPSAVARLIDLGADRFLIASSLLLVIAQRLARRICEHCATDDHPDDEVVRRLGLDHTTLEHATPRRGTGCGQCERTGTRGRLAISETLPITTRLRELVTEGVGETALTRQARLEGLRTLREEGTRRALEGIITLDEALRVTPDPSTDVARCPGCGEAVADDHVVCPWCSTPVASHHCAGCGRAVDADWQTCPWCRRSLRETATNAAG